MKGEFIQKCQDNGMSARAAEVAYDCFLEVLTNNLKEGGDGYVIIENFGTLKRKLYAKRTGRNIKTGAVVDVPSKYDVKFKSAKALEALMPKPE